MQFLKDMITLNPKNFGSADIPIGLILLCFAVGMIAATIIIQLTNATVYRVIKSLIRHKCTDEASAKSLKSLGLSGDRWVLFAIKRENPILMRYLSIASKDAAEECAAEAENATAACEDKTEGKEAYAGVKCAAQAKYYLSAQNLDRAKEILSRGEVGILQTVGLCGLLLVLYFAFAALATWLLPMFF